MVGKVNPQNTMNDGLENEMNKKINENEAESQEQSKKDKNYKLKLMINNIIRYGFLGFTVFGIIYKMFFFSPVEKKTTAKKPKISKQQELARSKETVKKKGSIALPTSNELILKPKSEVISHNLEIPVLKLPQVEDIKLETKEDNQKEQESKTPSLPSSNEILAPSKDIKEDTKEKKITESMPIMPKNNINKNKNQDDDFFIISSNSSKNISSKNKYKSKSRSQDDDFIIFDDSIISKERQDNLDANIKKTSNPHKTLQAGKSLEAVLITAINSEIPGVVVAVISRNIYSLSGNNVLIPAGSHAYGSYAAITATGQSRIAISWNNIVRPDGVQIAINAIASDRFGRAGINGDINHQYGEMLKNSILLSLLTTGVAVAIEKAANIGGVGQVVNNNGSVATTNISPANAAIQSMVSTSAAITKSMTQNLMEQVKPIVSIPEGSIINIIAQSELIIPPYKELY